MRALLAFIAATLAATIPAAAAAQPDSSQDRPLSFVPTGPSFHGDVQTFTGRTLTRHDRRRHRSGDGVIYIDRDYQGDSAWRSDSFNDWWHDRPERSYPRWMISNQNCDRMWWGGGAWRC
jgi:hypothetical protein